MPIKRKKTHIPALNSAVELLAYLQTNGHLDGVEVPDWATGGTSVEEMMEALDYLGDGEWLAGAYPNYGPVEAADRWLYQFMDGRPVPDKKDAQAHRRAIENGDIDEDEDIVLNDETPPKKEAAKGDAGAAKKPGAKAAKTLAKKTGARK